MERKWEFIRAAQQILELMYQKEGFLQNGSFTKDIEFNILDLQSCGREYKYNSLKQPFLKQLKHQNYKIVYCTEKTGIITGSIFITKDSTRLEVTMVLIRTQDGFEVKHIHLSHAPEGRIYQIKDSRERIYWVHESNIVYLEALHNHVMWHCRKQTVEAVGQLGRLEHSLSDNFIRIHRSYIVNKKHVSLVARCYATMDNGDTLQIPVKKYCEVRKKLAGDLETNPIP